MQTYADYLALADSFPFDVPETIEESTLSVHQQLLKSLGILVLGELEGTSTIVAFSEKHTKSIEIKDIGRMRMAHLIQWFGEEMELRVFSGAGDMPSSYDYSLNQVRNAIAAEGGKTSVGLEDSLGGGIWEINHRLLLVGGHEVATYNGSFEHSNVPRMDSRLIKFGDVRQWYDFDVLKDLLEQSADPVWRQNVLDELLELFGRWDNWKHPRDSSICAALVLCTWVQSVWDWRPLVFVTGATNSGKTTLLENTLLPLFGGKGGLCSFMNRVSEPGLRQKIGRSSRACILDEFESSKDRQNILRLSKTSGRGGTTVLGTAHQKAIEFGLKHILWCGAIETGLVEAADRNRFILLELEEVKKVPGRTNLHLPSDESLAATGMRALAVAMRLWRPVKARASELYDIGAQGIDRRLVESYSLPCAMLGVILGLNRDENHGLMQNCLEGRDLSNQQVSDEELVFGEIMGSIIHLGKGEQASVSQILFEPITASGGNMEALERHGIRWVKKSEDDYAGTRCLFFAHDTIRRQLLKGTRFESSKIDEVLCRMNGAKRDRHRIGGSRLRGVSIPEPTVFEITGDDKKNADSNNSTGEKNVEGGNGTFF